METMSLIEFWPDFIVGKFKDARQPIEKLIAKVENYFFSTHKLALEKCIVSHADVTDKIQIHLVFEGDGREWNIFISRLSYKENELPKIVRELNEKKLNSLFLQRKLEF